MTGAQHYREAERLMDGSTDPNGWGSDHPTDRASIAAAQVHATLALAAATAATRGIGPEGVDGWRDLTTGESWMEVDL